MKNIIMKVLDKTASAKDYALFIIMVMAAYAILNISLHIISITLSISLRLIACALPFIVASFVVLKVIRRKDK